MFVIFYEYKIHNFNWLHNSCCADGNGNNKTHVFKSMFHSPHQNANFEFAFCIRFVFYSNNADKHSFTLTRSNLFPKLSKSIANAHKCRHNARFNCLVAQNFNKVKRISVSISCFYNLYFWKTIKNWSFHHWVILNMANHLFRHLRTSDILFTNFMLRNF